MPLSHDYTTEENRLKKTVKEFSFTAAKQFQGKDKLTELLQML